MLDRRQFLLQSGSLLLVSSLPPEAHSATNRLTQKVQAQGLSILQGYTNEKSTQLTIDIPKAIEAVYELKDAQTAKISSALFLSSATFEKSDMRVDKIKFEGLELGHTYQFIVKNKANNAVLDERFLTPVDLSKKGAKIAFLSCMKTSQATKIKTWDSLQAVGADYLFFIGDNVYGDSALSHGPKVLWSKYLEGRQAMPFYRWKNLKPVIAVWDDHDFGRNDSGGDYQHKQQNLSIFNSFFSQEADSHNLYRGPGNSSFFKAFNQNFILADNRYFRGLADPNFKKSFLGRDQIDWISNLLQNSPASTLYFEGSPLFGRKQKGGTSYESTSPLEMQSFLKRLGQHNRPVLLGGGDLHYSEISKVDKKHLGYETFELISSSMHSSLKKNFFDNPNPALHGFLKENFIVMQNSGANNDFSWSVKCIGEKSKVAFETTLKIA